MLLIFVGNGPAHSAFWFTADGIVISGTVKTVPYEYDLGFAEERYCLRIVMPEIPTLRSE